MTPSTLNSRSIVYRTLIVVGVLLTITSFVSLLNLYSATEANKSTKSTTTAGNATVQPPIQQTYDGVGMLAPFRESALNSTTDTLKNTNNTARTDNSTKGSIGQSQRPLISTEPPVAKTKPTKTKLAAVTAAENQTYTTDNRLFVTGANGIFEIIAGPNGSTTIIQRAPKQKNCDFGGIVESSGVLYVNCSGNGVAYVYAATVSATPSFNSIYTYKSTILPNGLTADNSGHLYVASTFLGQILRFTPSVTNPLTFANTGVWLNETGPATNGIKFAASSIYWTDSMFVNRIAIKADGTPGKQARVLSALTVFDDLAINNDGILVADYVGGVIRSYDLNGRSTGTIGVSFNGPSSVAWARAPFPADALIVTERGSNQVTLVTP